MIRFPRKKIDPHKLPPAVLEKWSPDILTEGFVPIPKLLVRSLHRLFSGDDGIKELATILAIVDFRRPQLTRFPSLAYLSFLAGLTEEEFQAALQRLVSRSLIEVFGDPEFLDVRTDGLVKAILREVEITDTPKPMERIEPGPPDPPIRRKSSDSNLPF